MIRRRRMRVLLVEDNKADARLVQRVHDLGKLQIRTTLDQRRTIDFTTTDADGFVGPFTNPQTLEVPMPPPPWWLPLLIFLPALL